MFLDTPNRSYRSRGLEGLHFPGLLAFFFCAGLLAGVFVLRPHLSPAREEAVADRDSHQSQAPFWSRDGNPSARQPVEVLRTVDGDTFEARVHLWPGLDLTTRVTPNVYTALLDSGRVRKYGGGHREGWCR